MTPAEEFHDIWIRGHAARIIDQLSSGEPRRHADKILERVKNFLEHESFRAPSPPKATKTKRKGVV